MAALPTGRRRMSSLDGPDARVQGVGVAHFSSSARLPHHHGHHHEHRNDAQSYTLRPCHGCYCALLWPLSLVDTRWLAERTEEGANTRELRVVWKESGTAVLYSDQSPCRILRPGLLHQLSCSLWCRACTGSNICVW
jgi:hypothetical protein